MPYQLALWDQDACFMDRFAEAIQKRRPQWILHRFRSQEALVTALSRYRMDLLIADQEKAVFSLQASSPVELLLPEQAGQLASPLTGARSHGLPVLIWSKSNCPPNGRINRYQPVGQLIPLFEALLSEREEDVRSNEGASLRIFTSPDHELSIRSVAERYAQKSAEKGSRVLLWDPDPFRPAGPTRESGGWRSLFLAAKSRKLSIGAHFRKQEQKSERGYFYLRPDVQLQDYWTVEQDEWALLRSAAMNQYEELVMVWPSFQPDPKRWPGAGILYCLIKDVYPPTLYEGLLNYYAAQTERIHFLFVGCPGAGHEALRALFRQHHFACSDADEGGSFVSHQEGKNVW